MDVFQEQHGGTRHLLAANLTAAETNEIMELWAYIKPMGRTVRIIATKDEQSGLKITTSGTQDAPLTVDEVGPSDIYIG
jgi:glycine/serine hydroxymethyltransferase